MFVNDQEEALDFYTNKLGFVVKHDVPMGTHRWLTVTAPSQPDGPQLLLEPSTHKAVPPYKAALYADAIPAASFRVDDLDQTYERLIQAGVRFHTTPVDAGAVKMAVLDDHCGNLIQLIEFQ